MRTSIICILLCIGSAIGAADPGGADLLGDPPGPTPQGRTAKTGAEQRLAQAKGLASEGMELVSRFNADKSRNANAIVDAAIAFSKERQLLEGSGDPDAIAQVQANLYWCRKQMDADAIKAYLAQKGDAGKEAKQAMDAVAATALPADKAPGYLASANTWAKAHADDHLQIAIRYLEIAERFPSTPEATEANKRALDAQQRLMKQQAEAAAEARRTRFMAAQPASVGTSPIPDATAQKDAIALLRKTFAKAYQKRDQAAKARLANRLVEEAPKNRKDIPVYYAMLKEGLRLAGEGEDYAALLECADGLGAAFAGYDPAAEKRAELKKLGKPLGLAFAKLLDAADDPAANLLVGKWFCFTAHNWAEGLPMLVLGGDPALAKLSQMELDKPQITEERLLVADAWYDLGRKTGSKDDKTGMLTRALFWYQSAITEMSGLAKDRISGRMAEIDKQLPLDLNNIDWSTLTAGQWEKLKGTQLVIQAKVNHVEAGVVLAPGEKVRVVPHPTETWVVTNDWFGQKTVTWRGWDGKVASGGGTSYYRTERYTVGNQPVGALTCWAGTGPRKLAGEIGGEGPLLLAISRMKSMYGGEYSGQLRVKLIRVDD